MDLFVYYWTCTEICISQKSRDSGSPGQYLLFCCVIWWSGFSFWRIAFICLWLKIIRKLHIPRALGFWVTQTILVTILLDLVGWIVIWENWICLFRIENRRDIAYPKGPGTPGPQNHLKLYIIGPGGLDYHLGELQLFVYQWNYKRKLHIPKAPGPLVPPNRINYYILGLGGLAYHLGELHVCVYQLKCNENCISQGPRDQIQQTILITMFWDLVAWIIIWENWSCLFIIAHITGTEYPKGPGTTNPLKPC